MDNLMSVWSTIGSVALAILILLVMITIHELGHFIAGKILKFKIDEFSIGFGPPLVKLEWKETGQIFAVRLIPLGGYCAFHGEDGLEEEPTPLPPSTGGGEEGDLNGGGEEGDLDVSCPPPASGEPDVSCPPPASGETPSSCPPPASGETPSSCPPPASGGGVGEGVRPEPQPEPKRHWTDDGDFTNMKPWKRIIVLVAGATMNYLLALLLILIEFFSYGQTMLAVYETEEATGEYAAYSLQDFDIFLQAEGKDLYLTTDIAQALNGKKRGDLVEMRVSRAIGLTWVEDKEGNLVRDYDHREDMDIQVMLREDVTVKNSADLDCVWRALGIKYSETDETYMLANGLHHLSFFETIGKSFVYSFKQAGSIFRVLGELLTGRLGINAIGGPVTTITMTSQIASQGFRQFLEISSLIGVNLAVFNLLPIPALDGSKVVFTAIEWIRGKPISRKIEAIIHAVGFVLLIGFAILVDILQFV